MHLPAHRATHLFRGLDDTQKIKSIKLPFGYIGVLWFEEADQIKGGEDAVRNVQQSALRGGEFGLTFISFNPPAAARNWANKYALAQRPGKRVHHSSYLEAPPEWLGPKFLAQAEYIKETRPTKYRHEYLGEAVGNGTQVFDNIRLEELSNKRIRSFGDALNGVDWGWYPDPWAFNRCWYDAGRRTLYIFDELTRLKINNQETARLVLGADRTLGDSDRRQRRDEELRRLSRRRYPLPRGGQGSRQRAGIHEMAAGPDGYRHRPQAMPRHRQGIHRI